jgi:hypothetical protein
MENSQIVGLTTSLLEDDKKNIMTTARRLAAERLKEKMEKGATIVHAAKLYKDNRIEIHTALAMLTVCSGGTLFPITVTIAGILLTVGPVIETVGNYSELKLLFNLVFDYCLRFYKTFMVVSRMMYLITIFSKNRRHFKILLYGDMLADIKSKLGVIQQEQQLSNALNSEVHIMTEIDIVRESVKDPSTQGLEEFTALLDQWKKEGYGESKDMFATGTMFPQNIYDDVTRTVSELFTLLVDNVDSTSLQKLVELDQDDMFGFRKEQAKRGRFFSKPDIIRKWMVSNRKDQIIADFNTHLTRIASGMLLMKLHVDTLMMYIESYCSEEEVKLLHVAITTSPEFIAYIEPTYNMDAIINRMEMKRLKMFKTSIIADLKSDEKIDAEQIKKQFDEVLLQIKRNSQTAAEATMKIQKEPLEATMKIQKEPSEATMKEEVTVKEPSVPLEKKRSLFNWGRTSKVAPTTAPASRSGLSRFKFWGGSRTRKRRRRGGVSLRRRGRAI